MKIKILQIDDDLINNMANERLIKKTGVDFELINFLDPTEALKFLSETKEVFNFILLDINMPKINGWEFMERYSAFDKPFPIIMLTSSLDPNDQKRAKLAPLLKGFYTKPLTVEIITEILGN